MRPSRSICLLLVLIISAGLTAGDQNSSITTGSLFREMTDMLHLTYFPSPGYRMVQYSSYDHRSTLPGGPHWFANSDGFGGEPVPNFEAVLREPGEDGTGEYLMADVSGPGAIVRVWTAAIEGTVKLYIDNMETPVIEAEANTFFHNPYSLLDGYGKIDKDTFEGAVVQRDASYAPIPFAERMRLTWTGNVKRIHFYQMQVRIYEPGTPVISFSPEDIPAFAETINRTARILADPDVNYAITAPQKPVTFEGGVAPGNSLELVSLDQPGAIGIFELHLDADDTDLALRQSVLHVICDDHPWGQVQCPAGDFFGAAPGINPYVSMPFTVMENGRMICRYIMPFEKNIRIILENKGDQAVSVTGKARPMSYEWTDRSMHFRARWRADHDLIANPRAVQDLPFLIASGKGIYVGSVSYLMNPNPVPTPYGSWWGEGDEKVFVDNAGKPSLFGTGSEDYYNYSWSVPHIFIHPYCGQPRNDGPGNRGFVTNYRYHILDPIPFLKEIRFYMELYSHERTPGLSYARIGYHYALPGITDDHLALMPGDVKPLKMPEKWIPAMRMGARNSVQFTAEDQLGIRTNITGKPGYLWEKGQLMVWKPAAKGAAKTFNFQVEKGGKKRIHCVFAHAPGSGIVSFRVDGRQALLNNKAETLDLHRPYRILSRSHTLQTVELDAGEHTLTLIYQGASAGMAGEIGFDFFWVQDN
jgi:hypothetical protein